MRVHTHLPPVTAAVTCGQQTGVSSEHPPPVTMAVTCGQQAGVPSEHPFLLPWSREWMMNNLQAVRTIVGMIVTKDRIKIL